MEFECKTCSKSFKTEESLQQHNLVKHPTERKEQKRKINFKKYFIIFSVIIIIVLIIFSVLNYVKKPGKYDDFARCLSEKGVVIYGNDFCQYTAQQLNYFGKSEKYLNYIRCSENEKLCNEKGIKITPTWEINGSFYEQVQTFERLSTLTGCKI